MVPDWVFICTWRVWREKGMEQDSRWRRTGPPVVFHTLLRGCHFCQLHWATSCVLKSVVKGSHVWSKLRCDYYDANQEVMTEISLTGYSERLRNTPSNKSFWSPLISWHLSQSLYGCLLHLGKGDSQPGRHRKTPKRKWSRWGFGWS